MFDVGQPEILTTGLGLWRVYVDRNSLVRAQNVRPIRCAGSITLELVQHNESNTRLTRQRMDDPIPTTF